MTRGRPYTEDDSRVVLDIITDWTTTEGVWRRSRFHYSGAGHILRQLVAGGRAERRTHPYNRSVAEWRRLDPR